MYHPTADELRLTRDKTRHGELTHRKCPVTGHWWVMCNVYGSWVHDRFFGSSRGARAYIEHCRKMEQVIYG